MMQNSVALEAETFAIFAKVSAFEIVKQKIAKVFSSEKIFFS